MSNGIMSRFTGGPKLAPFLFLCIAYMFFVLIGKIEDLKREINDLESQFWIVTVVQSIHQLKLQANWLQLQSKTVWKHEKQLQVSASSLEKEIKSKNPSPPMNINEPDVFRNVKEVPAMFTADSFDFTMPDKEISQCECNDDTSWIRNDWDYIPRLHGRTSTVVREDLTYIFMEVYERGKLKGDLKNFKNMLQKQKDFSEITSDRSHRHKVCLRGINLDGSEFSGRIKYILRHLWNETEKRDQLFSTILRFR